MTAPNDISSFLSSYSDEVGEKVILLRNLLLKSLPNVIEQLDIPARMIAYSYSQKYSGMICTIIPSKKGVKLGFYKGNELPDPDGILKGTGKISRYVEIDTVQQIRSASLENLIKTALKAWQSRTDLSA